MPELRAALPAAVRAGAAAPGARRRVRARRDQRLRCARTRRSASAGIASTLVAALLGGSQVPVGTASSRGRPFLGLDWFLLNLIVYSAVFIPLERLFALRPEQPRFRAGWRTDLTYFCVELAARPGHDAADDEAGDGALRLGGACRACRRGCAASPSPRSSSRSWC